MKVALAYGKEKLWVELPDSVQVQVVEPQYTEGFPDQVQAIRDALDKPIGHKSLSSLVKKDQKVAIIFNQKRALLRFSTCNQKAAIQNRIRLNK